MNKERSIIHVHKHGMLYSVIGHEYRDHELHFILADPTDPQLRAIKVVKHRLLVPYTTEDESKTVAFLAANLRSERSVRVFIQKIINKFKSNESTSRKSSKKGLSEYRS